MSESFLSVIIKRKRSSETGTHKMGVCFCRKMGRLKRVTERTRSLQNEVGSTTKRR